MVTTIWTLLFSFPTLDIQLNSETDKWPSIICAGGQTDSMASQGVRSPLLFRFDAFFSPVSIAEWYHHGFQNVLYDHTWTHTNKHIQTIWYALRFGIGHQSAVDLTWDSMFFFSIEQISNVTNTLDMDKQQEFDFPFL